MPKRTPEHEAKLKTSRAKFVATTGTIFRKFAKIGQDCTVCKNAQTQKAGKGWTIICTLGRKEEAKDCPEFKDARKATP